MYKRQSVIFNWLFVFGNLGAPACGVVGSALANILARMLECAILIVYSLGFEKKIRFRFSWILHPQKVLWPSFVKNCAPAVSYTHLFNSEIIPLYVYE